MISKILNINIKLLCIEMEQKCIQKDRGNLYLKKHSVLAHGVFSSLKKIVLFKIE